MYVLLRFALVFLSISICQKKKIFQLTAHRKENQKKETTMSTADESFLRGLTPRERREILNLEERLRLERDEVGFSPRRRYY